MDDITYATDRQTPSGQGTFGGQPVLGFILEKTFLLLSDPIKNSWETAFRKIFHSSIKLNFTRSLPSLEQNPLFCLLMEKVSDNSAVGFELFSHRSDFVHISDPKGFHCGDSHINFSRWLFGFQILKKVRRFPGVLKRISVL